MKLSVPHWAPSRVAERLDAAIEATRAETLETTRKIEGDLHVVTNQMVGYATVIMDNMRDDVEEATTAWTVAGICVASAAMAAGLYFATKLVRELWP